MRIEIALSGRLEALSKPANAKVLAEAVRSDVAELIEHLGLAGGVDVRVTYAPARDGRRPLRVIVNDTAAPFPPDVLAQLWLERSDYWAGISDVRRSIARDYIEAICGEGECAPDDIANLVSSVVRDSAALLVDDELATSFGSTSDGNGCDSAVLREVLAALIDLGVAPRPKEAVLDALASNKNRLQDSVEAAFTLLQGRQIEVCVSPSYHSILTDRSDADLVAESARGEDAKQLFAAAEERLVVEWAIVPPDIVWTAVDTIRDRAIFVRVNDRLSPELRGLDGQERVVFEDESPPELDVKRTMLNPANTAIRLNIVDASRADQLTEPISTLTPAGFAAHVVYRELISNAFRLVGTEQTLFLLQDVEARTPELVHLILQRFTVAEITQILRALVRERIPPRLLPVMLERLALVSDEVPPEERAECVRRGLSSYVFQRFLGVGATSGRTPVELSPEIEKGLAGPTGADPLYAENVRDAIWTTLRGTGIPPMRAAVVVREAPRDAVYRAVGPELPDVVVLSRSEVEPDEAELRSDKVAPTVASAAFQRAAL
jgi:type III secretory pathway component EscV